MACYKGRSLARLVARDPCAKALQRTWVRLPARVPLLRVTPPLLPCFLSHSSAVLSIKPEKKKTKKRSGMLKKWKMPERPKSTPHLFFVCQQKCLLAYKFLQQSFVMVSIQLTDLSSFFSIFQTSVSVCAWRRTGWTLILRQKVPVHWLCHLCVMIQYPVLDRTSAVAPLYYFLTHATP